MKNKSKNLGRGKKLIPTGNHLLSKHPDIFLPNKWPEYYKKLKEFIFGTKITKNILICV